MNCERELKGKARAARNYEQKDEAKEKKKSLKQTKSTSDLSGHGAPLSTARRGSNTPI